MAVMDDGTSPKAFQNWVVEKELGQGTFSVVVQARHKTTGQIAALKYAKSDSRRKFLREEAEILEHLQECACK